MSLSHDDKMMLTLFGGIFGIIALFCVAIGLEWHFSGRYEIWFDYSKPIPAMEGYIYQQKGWGISQPVNLGGSVAMAGGDKTQYLLATKPVTFNVAKLPPEAQKYILAHKSFNLAEDRGGHDDFLKVHDSQVPLLQSKGYKNIANLGCFEDVGCFTVMNR